MMRLRGPVCSCCKARPYFGMPGDARPSCCANCKTADMVDIKNRKCTCGKTQPFYGVPGDTQPSCCAKCKTADMVDIRSRKCTCGKRQPFFGLLGDARPSCCAKCKTADMVAIGKRACKCGKTWAAFGLPGDARASCCAACKTAYMMDIVSPKCSVCGKHAVFPDAFGKPRQLCAVHSAEVGAHLLSSPRYSRVSNDCLDALEEETGHEFPFRYRLDKTTGTWSGSEFAGLIPGRALQPDAYNPRRREVVEFLGNYYHGFPPDHPQHSSFVCVGGRPALELYQETMTRLDLFVAAGLRVSYVWEHEFTEWQKAAAVSTALPISSILRPHNRTWPR
ncbi:unnamed protein product [Effrenium voratum]|uniref:Uncharacterized protein n=1 Tax=Effrenium voratum TaxID=2562239 RepID=A0AA36J3D4_9DINO|nr:unnamed protein product [Effrenium voratum]